MDAIVVNSLVKQFHTDSTIITAVNNLSLSIPQGKIVGLLGPNGAGKTTTIRIIASIYRSTSGSIRIMDQDIADHAIEIRGNIGIAHENPSFYKKLTGRRNLKFYADLYDVPKDQIDERIDNLARDFDLSEAIDQPVGGYSKGMRQKLSVTKALIHDPAILILDEPWSGLSPGATRDLRNKILELGKQGKTILITTHNLSQAEQVADKLVIISKGSLVARGSPEELRQQYHINPQLLVSVVLEPEPDVIESLKGNPLIHELIKQPGSNSKIEYLVTMATFDDSPAVIRLLVEAGFELREVREKIPSLEEIYLELVEEER